jgi:anaerobic selenocysteine-containing dehydrogenase
MPSRRDFLKVAATAGGAAAAGLIPAKPSEPPRSTTRTGPRVPGAPHPRRDPSGC